MLEATPQQRFVRSLPPLRVRTSGARIKYTIYTVCGIQDCQVLIIHRAGVVQKSAPNYWLIAVSRPSSLSVTLRQLSRSVMLVPRDKDMARIHTIMSPRQRILHRLCCCEWDANLFLINKPIYPCNTNSVFSPPYRPTKSHLVINVSCWGVKNTFVVICQLFGAQRLEAFRHPSSSYNFHWLSWKDHSQNSELCLACLHMIGASKIFCRHGVNGRLRITTTRPYCLELKALLVYSALNGVFINFWLAFC